MLWGSWNKKINKQTNKSVSEKAYCYYNNKIIISCSIINNNNEMCVSQINLVESVQSDGSFERIFTNPIHSSKASLRCLNGNFVVILLFFYNYVFD